MSFLNPTSEPVLMYSSTDANAPQLNSTRAAGDVKTILKACLITGYGSKASAGWTMQNETVTVAEFIAPATNLSNCTIGITDESRSYFTFYYKVDGTKYDLYGLTNIYKQPDYIDQSKNEWYLLVTKQGFYFVESFFNSRINKKLARIGYVGAIKHALKTDGGKNIVGFSTGYRGNYIKSFLNTGGRLNLKLDTFGSAMLTSANAQMVADAYNDSRAYSAAELVCTTYYYQGTAFLGEQPGWLISTVNDSSKVFGVYQTTYENRPVLFACIGYEGADLNTVARQSAASMIYLDRWDY